MRRMLLPTLMMLTLPSAAWPQAARDTTPDLSAITADLERIKADLETVKGQLAQVLRLLSQRPSQGGVAATGPVRASVADAPMLGRADAPVTIVEFSDYQCPACGAFKPIVEQIVEKYKDKILFAYRNFPLAQHEFAEKAAEVAEAAGEQGKYFEMHDYLFANQANFSDEVYQAGAKKIGLDMDKFNEALKSGKFKSLIQDDISFGVSHGVNSTPTFFLNGKKLTLFNQSDLETEVAKVIGK